MDIPDTRITVGMINKLFRRNSTAQTPLEKLWLGVLCQAVADAQQASYARTCKTFFDIKNKWFVQVCEFAGLCPEFVLEYVSKVNSHYSRKYDKR